MSLLVLRYRVSGIDLTELLLFGFFHLVKHPSCISCYQSHCNDSGKNSKNCENVYVKVHSTTTSQGGYIPRLMVRIRLVSSVQSNERTFSMSSIGRNVPPLAADAIPPPTKTKATVPGTIPARVPTV